MTSDQIGDRMTVTIRIELDHVPLPTDLLMSPNFVMTGTVDYMPFVTDRFLDCTCTYADGRTRRACIPTVKVRFSPDGQLQPDTLIVWWFYPDDNTHIVRGLDTTGVVAQLDPRLIRTWQQWLDYNLANYLRHGPHLEPPRDGPRLTGPERLVQLAAAVITLPREQWPAAALLADGFLGTPTQLLETWAAINTQPAQTPSHGT
jgi:hypothetical protein